MNIRAYETTDFGVLMKFWTHKGHLPEIPEGFLPPIGRVIEESGVLLAAAFLIQSDTEMASIAFVCGNPSADSLTRSKALDSVLQELKLIAKQIGYRMLGAASNVPALQARFERLGLTQTDRDVICYGGLI